MTKEPIESIATLSARYSPPGARILCVCVNETHRKAVWEAFRDVLPAKYVIVGESLSGHQFDRILVFDRFSRGTYNDTVMEWLQQISTRLSPGAVHGVHYL